MRVKKVIILSLILMVLLIPIIKAYQYVNETGYSLNMDFANGGVQEQSNGYNTSSIIGESLTPFNDTTGSYKINQGLYYIIWSNVILGLPPALLLFSFDIEDFGIEWIKLNFT